MKKKALKKDFYVEIKKTFNRFISIFLIVAMGVAFFSGIRAAEPDMRLSTDEYFDDNSLHDIQVLGTYGITDNDIAKLSEIDEVENIEAGYYSDLLSQIKGNQRVLRVYSMLPEMDKFTVLEGELPSDSKECLLDIDFAESESVKIGDVITLYAPDDDKIEDTLKQSEFKVTGFAASPLYVSFDRGSTNVGNGQVSGFIAVLDDAFNMEVYTYLNIAVKGSRELTAFTDEYEQRIETVVNIIEDNYSDLRCEARYNEIIDEADKELADAETELNDAKKEAEEKLDDAAKTLADADKELADAQTELNDAKLKLEDGKRELEKGKKEAADAEVKLADGRAEYEDGVLEYKLGLDKYIDGVNEYEENKAKLEEAEKLIEESRKELDAGWAEYENNKEQIEEAEKSYKELKEAIDNMVAAGMAPTEEMLYNLAVLETAISEGSKALEAALKELEQAEAVLVPKEKELAAAFAELDKGWLKLKEADEQLREARAKLREAEQELMDGEQKLKDAKEELKNGEQEIKDGEAEVLDAEIKLTDAKLELEDGHKEYEDKKKEADEKISDAEEELADAREEIDKLEKPKWYVNDRDSVSAYTECGDNADRIKAIGEVFPVIFFLVAALISLTTMTRMVEEQRTQIGILKALGYNKLSIAGKYILYALTATLFGSIFGVLAGQKILPYIIITAYKIMYPYIPNVLIPYNIEYALLAAIAAIACTTLAAFLACYKELLSQPSELMRPVPPKQGKRIILERIPFIWNRMNFTGKSTFRNLIRYKKRFFMTVFGIGGCMGLMIVGFGLRDSILDIAVKQYSELQLYEANVIMDTDADDKDKEALFKSVKDNAEIEDSMTAYMENADVLNSKEANIKKSAYIVIPKETDKFGSYIVLRNRETKEIYSLDNDGAIMTEKLAKMLDLSEGDYFDIILDDNTYNIKLSKIAENYMSHFIYMSEELYKNVTNKSADYNTIFFKTKDKAVSVTKSIGENILKLDAAVSVSYLDTLKGQVDDMLESLDIVIIVLIISAGMLAFVVLYNLNNININERKRELASIKVLGFYDKELAAYVYRENVLLTIIGVLLGAGIGKLLHRFIIVTVEIENCMFGRDIYFRSYLLSALLTLAFAVFVNGVMYFKLKKINMVESLKSVE